MIAALMNPYLESTNGKLLLLSILDSGMIWLEDLPGLDKYKDLTTGHNTMCWAGVVGMCHFPGCYFGQRGGHLDSTKKCGAGDPGSGARGCGMDDSTACLGW